jgi:hypothetical protein
MLFSINNKLGFAFKFFLLRTVSPEANTRVAEKTKSSTMEEETGQISLVIHSLLKIIFDSHRIRRTNHEVGLCFRRQSLYKPKVLSKLAGDA